MLNKNDNVERKLRSQVHFLGRIKIKYKVTRETYRFFGECLPGEVELVDVSWHCHPPVHGVVVHHALTHVVQLRRQSCNEYRKSKTKNGDNELL